MSVKRHIFLTVLVLSLGGFMQGPANAGEVNLAQGLPFVEVMHEGKKIKIERVQDQEHAVTGFWAKTSRKCPPFCIHSIEAAPGVSTVGELELIDFLRNQVTKGTGVLIDARTPDWYLKGTIPGSVNIPFTVFTVVPDEADERGKAQLRLRETLRQFGVKTGALGTWDFSEAKDLLLFCNGVWCDQSPRAIKGLLALGYPVSKLKYYRGGMQEWMVLGLTVVTPTTKVVTATER
jgi:rhodanese-related sulfurtransferase